MAVTNGPIPTLPAADLDRARDFYVDVLQCTPGDDAPPGSVLLNLGEGQLLVFETPTVGTARNTQVAWFVDDLDAEVARLQAAGVEFTTFDAPDMEWDGVIATDGGFRSAWFTDTEGNTLSVGQDPGA